MQCSNVVCYCLRDFLVPIKSNTAVRRVVTGHGDGLRVDVDMVRPLS